ncbi:MAG: 50S ribosomal protein L18 [Patescibacteria group bacterium]
MNKKRITKRERRERRRLRVRAKISGTAEKPRLNIHRSLNGMYIQLIDDQEGKTLAALNSKTAEVQGDAGERKGKVAQAYLLGKLLAEKAKILKIETVVFDRAGYKYHGKIKALAEGARENGLLF